MNIKSKIKYVYVEKAIEENINTQKILDVVKKDYITFNNLKELDLPLFQSKETLILAEQRGDFLKKCPGTPCYKCCCYFVLELGVGCPFDCTYCFLQEYQNIPATLFYMNFDKMFQEFDAFLYKHPNNLFRIGTGEYSDSMFLDEYIDYTGMISSYLAKRYNNYLIEYKTKSDDIDNLLKYKPTGKEVISWSINPKSIVDSEEKGTASLKDRLLSAKRCAEHGYYIGIHFDPLIIFKGWEDEYRETVDHLFDMIPKEKIIWISIGSLRYNPRLKPIMEQRHKNSSIMYGETGKGVDGKVRYIKSLRINLYTKIVEYIKSRDNDAFIYFCMEDQDVWKEVLKEDISSNADIDMLFKKRYEKL